MQYSLRQVVKLRRSLQQERALAARISLHQAAEVCVTYVVVE